MEKEVRNLLRGFFKWKPKLKPVSDLRKLREQVAEAIFWQEVPPEIIAVSKEDLILFWSGKGPPLYQVLTTRFMGEVNGNLKKGKLEELREWLERELPFGPKQKGVAIENRLWEALESHWYKLSNVELQLTMRAEMRLNLWYILFLAAAFCLLGDKSKNFQRLLDLLLEGHIPAWFTRQGDRLLILCGKDKSF